MTYREAKGIVRQLCVMEVYDNVQKRPYTMITLKATFEGHAYHGVGFAKCCPRDEWDAELGRKIAIGRAEAEVARQIMVAAETWDIYPDSGLRIVERRPDTDAGREKAVKKAALCMNSEGAFIANAIEEGDSWATWS